MYNKVSVCLSKWDQALTTPSPIVITCLKRTWNCCTEFYCFIFYHQYIYKLHAIKTFSVNVWV